jgi:hypothetical protein
VYFRAPNISAANGTILAMFGAGEEGLSANYSGYVARHGFSTFFNLLANTPSAPVSLIPLFFALTFLAVLFMPNSAQLFNLIDGDGRLQWKPSASWAMVLGTMLVCSLVGMFGVSEFIYFQF